MNREHNEPDQARRWEEETFDVIARQAHQHEPRRPLVHFVEANDEAFKEFARLVQGRLSADGYSVGHVQLEPPQGPLQGAGDDFFAKMYEAIETAGFTHPDGIAIVCVGDISPCFVGDSGSGRSTRDFLQVPLDDRGGPASVTRILSMKPHLPRAIVLMQMGDSAGPIATWAARSDVIYCPLKSGFWYPVTK